MRQISRPPHWIKKVLIEKDICYYNFLIWRNNIIWFHLSMHRFGLGWTPNPHNPIKERDKRCFQNNQIAHRCWLAKHTMMLKSAFVLSVAKVRVVEHTLLVRRLLLLIKGFSWGFWVLNLSILPLPLLWIALPIHWLNDINDASSWFLEYLQYDRAVSLREDPPMLGPRTNQPCRAGLSLVGRVNSSTCLGQLFPF